MLNNVVHFKYTKIFKYEISFLFLNENLQIRYAIFKIKINFEN